MYILKFQFLFITISIVCYGGIINTRTLLSIFIFNYFLVPSSFFKSGLILKTYFIKQYAFPPNWQISNKNPRYLSFSYLRSFLSNFLLPLLLFLYGFLSLVSPLLFPCASPRGGHRLCYRLS